MGIDTEDHLLLVGQSDDGAPLDETDCRRMLDLSGESGHPCDVPSSIVATLKTALLGRRQQIVEHASERGSRWFDTEMDKLDHWAEDRRTALKSEVTDLDEALKEAKKVARQAPTLPEKLQRQRVVKTLEARRDEAWRAFDQGSREILAKKDALLDEIARRLEQAIDEDALVTLRWRLA